MPKLTIDGKEVEFQPGQTIIQAAATVGIDIPHFCWHPKLSVSGNCRVCLVEIEKMPKLAISCATQAAEGMVVHTNSEKTLAARKAVMEFILINHPLDCPVCDEAGECKLQEYTYKHSIGESRFTEEKQHKEKRVPLGPHVMFDGERCISCSRCIRFCTEVAGDTQLTFVQRGDRVTINTFPGKELDNPYSMNVTDICPVGALTSRDFRFNSRVWDLSATNSICQGCSKGCNIQLWVKANKVLRLTPRHNQEVNSFWMCDEGRLNTFKNINAENRINGPHLKRNGGFTRVSWDEAFSAAISELKGFSREEIAYIGSGFATVEDNYMLAKLAKTVSGTKYIDAVPHLVPGSGDAILRTEDKTPNMLGATLTGMQGGKSIEQILQLVSEHKIRALYVIDEDLVSNYPQFAEAIKKLDLLIVHAVNENATTQIAHIVLPSASYAEKHGTMVNIDGRIQRIRPAVTTIDADRTLDGLSLSRLDKFGTEYDRWGRSDKIDARPTWKIILGILSAFGQRSKITMADELFHEIAENVPAFRGINYDTIGEQGVVLNINKTTSVYGEKL
ncbi:MAG: molybdopterin-dependent oxidoreductase [Ignavibacteria bacterium]|nr:molybdopterin-dependent oxidoreductase [Ignavibacteria bacterium]